MVVTTVTTLALYCPHCGKINIHDVSQFVLNTEQQIELQCSCGCTQAKVVPAKGKRFFLRLYCKLCRQYHMFTLSYRGSSSDSLHKLYCHAYNLEIGFIGIRSLVEQTLAEHRSAVEQSVPVLAPVENENPELLLAVLNRLHDIAETGGIACCCGCNSIRAEVFALCIELNCQTCGASLSVAAATEADLARLKNVERIELQPLCHLGQIY